MRHKLSRSEVRTTAATQLLDTLHRYIYARPLDENERLLFEEIPLAKYALAAHVPSPRTALHELLSELVYNEWYIMNYDDLQFDRELIPEARNFLSMTFSEMRMTLPPEFATDDPEEFRVARNKYRKVFLDGLHFIVKDTFALSWSMKALLADFNETLAASIRNVRLADDSRLAADGCLPRPRNWPAWLVQALHLRDGGICQKCSRAAIASLGSLESPHIDHVVALANGGGNDPTNLRLLCASCNLKKGARNDVITDHFAWPYARPN